MYKVSLVSHTLIFLAFVTFGFLILFGVSTPSLQTVSVIAYWSMALCHYIFLMLAKKD